MRSVDDFANAPWDDLDEAVLASVTRVPTMLTSLEQQLYMWLTGEWAQGIGDVVDLGSFVGGSTARLALGWTAAGHTGQIHAFDRFTAKELTKENQLYSKGIAAFEGTDILPLSQELLAPFAPQITFHKGQIEDQTWHGTPIEIMTLDASKSPTSMDAMLEQFFPSLIPGASVIVQQDFLHWRQPWIPVQMELLSDYFEPVAVVPDDTVLFLNTQAITPEAIAQARTAHLTDEEWLTILERARKRYQEFGAGFRIKRAMAAVRANPGKRISWEMSPPP